IRLDFPENRFTLPLALGVSFLFVSVLKIFVKNRAKQIIIVGVAIGFATSSHFQLAKSFKTERHLQKEFIWQMVWRAPKIDSGTAIIIQDHPFNYTDDEGLTGLVNWIYAPDNSSPDLPYVLIGNQPEYFAEDGKIIRVSLDTFFHGSKNQSLWVHYSPPGCLHVLDANYDKQIWIYPGSIYEQASFSNVSYIDTSATFPGMEEDVLNILGPEPNHGWCYFYQMANRARQNKDWDTIVMLGEEANALDLRYYQPIEALPFIEGYARDRRWEQANNLTKDVLANTRSLQVPLCSIWEEAEREMVLDNKDQDHIQQLKSSIGCQQN
ncbi:MAG: hypothetical protein U9Q82_03310, partial [Chloroflexota bacterium]|nr:hypothetical protein [Chloroflexota bacterium]